ncbi:MAG: ATP-binding cassette domain-containing protein [Christensenellaceae bacterium]
MLESVHLTKVYKTKGGTDVRALDDVSLRFPERGMVFLLGKSGSGKSTLLNVCGGLDSPTSGEIVVKGRSSKNFTQSDFDSYRNTFVGFVFQEYNILNEFSVEDNIALALELQGKPKDKKAIAALLEEVDLTGYAKRKPNTLSGGQKQRIAIARALVKSPEIIMADEPTGALDSATGKQVFDTLKKLSKSKLVIVVSHDREFAELYGDRVIELKDGKVISDVTKTQEKSTALSGNLSAAGDTLCVKSGAELTAADFEEIKAFLSKTKGSVVIAGGEKDVKTFKQAARLTDDGEKEVFKETSPDATPKKNYSPQESSFIRSKLPVRHAVKIGVSGLKAKPVRLFFTILLCMVSFVMFGLLSTMMVYDESATLKKSLLDSDYTTLQLNKKYKVIYRDYEGDKLNYEWESESDTKFTEEEVNAYKAQYGKKVLGAVKYGLGINNVYPGDYGEYYNSSISYLLSASDGAGFADRLLAGKFPQSQDEICISSYTADCILQRGLYNPETGSDDRYTLTEDRTCLIGKKLNLIEKNFTIVGIFDCGTLPARYDTIKNRTNTDYNLSNSFGNDLRGGLYQAAFFHDELIEKKNPFGNGEYIDFWQYFNSNHTLELTYGDESAYSAYYTEFDTVKDVFTPLFIDSEKTSLAKNEILLSPSYFSSLVKTLLWQKNTELNNAIRNAETDEQRNEAQRRYAEFSYEQCDAYEYDEDGNPKFDENGNMIVLSPGIESKLGFLAYGHNYNTGENFTKQELLGFFTETTAFIKKWEIALPEVSLQLDSAGHSFSERCMPVGILCPEPDKYSSGENFVILDKENYEKAKIVSDELYSEPEQEFYRREIVTKYVEPENAVYGAIFLPYDRTSATTDTIVSSVGKFADDDSKILLGNALSEGLAEVNYMVKTLSQVFLWAGLVLAIFSALLLCNFISASISYKKKEIGILRAVGARSFDVFKIFFSESFVITAICVLLSIVGGGVVCAVLNKEFAVLLSGASVFVFGPLSILMLIGVAFLTAVLATFLPVYHAARKKPVESIRAL